MDSSTSGDGARCALNCNTRRGFLARSTAAIAAVMLGRRTLADEKAGQDALGSGNDSHLSSIRLSEGDCIELDGKGDVRVRYLRGRIEFLNGDKCVAHINMYGDDHEL